jgi:hypothetical protein
MKKTWGIISLALFCIGLALSVIGGLVFPANATAAMVLVIIGLIVGIIYVIFDKEGKQINTLLLATIALLAMTAAFTPIAIMGVGKMVTSMLLYFAALMAPVALIAAIRALVKIGLSK